MRAPRNALVVDTSILIAMARGRSASILGSVADRHRLLVTDVAVSEAVRRLELGMKAPEFLPPLRDAIVLMNLVSIEGEFLNLAKEYLRDAVSSRNGSIKDSHILACAWAFDADIWSFDRDFAGTGVASWSTPNLERSLATPSDSPSPTD